MITNELPKVTTLSLRLIQVFLTTLSKILHNNSKQIKLKKFLFINLFLFLFIKLYYFFCS